MHLLRRTILIIISLVVLIFLSTPSTILSAVKRIDYLSITDAHWVKHVPIVGNTIATYLPPLMILAINQILLVMIDLIAVIEQHHSHSNFQASIFVKAVIYLVLNMLFIPAITLSSSESVFKYIYEKHFNFQ